MRSLIGQYHNLVLAPNTARVRAGRICRPSRTQCCFPDKARGKVIDLVWVMSGGKFNMMRRSLALAGPPKSAENWWGCAYLKKCAYSSGVWSVWRSATEYEGGQQRITIVGTSASCACETLAKVAYAVRTIVHDQHTDHGIGPVQALYRLVPLVPYTV